MTYCLDGVHTRPVQGLAVQSVRYLQQRDLSLTRERARLKQVSIGHGTVHPIHTWNSLRLELHSFVICIFFGRIRLLFVADMSIET